MTGLDPSAVEAPTTWDLDVIFKGGVEGKAFKRELERMSAEISHFETEVRVLPDVAADPGAWVDALQQPAVFWSDLRALMTVALGTYAAHTRQESARLARERASRLVDRLVSAEVPLQASLDELDDQAFADLISREELEAQRPMLEHARRNMALRLPRDQAELSAALSPYAVGGWSSLYTSLSGELEAEIELPGEGTVTRSVGQLAGLLGSPDSTLRERAHEASTAAWQTVTPVCARILDNITGARAALNARRGVDVIADTCGRNRIEPTTLDALWAASDHAHERLVAYLQRKARLLGKERPAFWDLRAALPSQGDSSVSWSDACTWVVESFAAYDPEMGAFAERAINERWIEAEARPNKRAGGFCARVGTHAQSRIFLTWSDTLRSAMTLAHELGHAWHNEMLYRQHEARRQVTSATAETASTFAEALFRDRLLARATDDEVRLRMLDQQAMAGVTFLMDIRARYRFELELYNLQSQGPLTASQLSRAMVSAQQQCFGADTLSDWDPTYWASKLHFYIGSFGFYNWPYAFGYLFSSAVYARAMQEGPSFAPQVRRLLSETGYRWTEDVARDLLGADLADPSFWQGATLPLLSAIDAFMDATEDA